MHTYDMCVLRPCKKIRCNVAIEKGIAKMARKKGHDKKRAIAIRYENLMARGNGNIGGCVRTWR